MKYAIVTGGSRGIGRGIVEKLVEDGYFVYFIYRSCVENARDIENNLGKDRVRALQCSIDDFGEIERLIDEIKKEAGRIDVLVNNAGITKDNWFAMMAFDDFKKVIDINFLGMVFITRQVVRTMISQKEGVIVNIASISGILGTAGQSNYASSKSAVMTFTKTIARELGKYNIRVLSIAPGFIETEMYAKIPFVEKKKLLKEVALKRVGTIEEISNVVSFMVSNKASYITGTTIVVDGGLV